MGEDKQDEAADQAAAAAGDGRLNVAREGAADAADGTGDAAADGTAQQAAGDGAQQAEDAAAAAAAAAKEAEAARLAKAAGIVGRTVVLYTQFGPIKVKLLEQLAPKTTALVWQLAQERGCKDCAFYRCGSRHMMLCADVGYCCWGSSGSFSSTCSYAGIYFPALPDAALAQQACCHAERLSCAGRRTADCTLRHLPCAGTRRSRGWARGRPTRCCRAACQSWQT